MVVTDSMGTVIIYDLATAQPIRISVANSGCGIKGAYLWIRDVNEGYFTIYDFAKGEPRAVLSNLYAPNGFSFTKTHVAVVNKENKLTVYELAMRQPVTGLVDLDVRTGCTLLDRYLIREDWLYDLSTGKSVPSPDRPEISLKLPKGMELEVRGGKLFLLASPQPLSQALDRSAAASSP